MRRISSPVAGMKAPCVFSGARAEWETAAGYQDNNSLLIVQQVSGFSKGGYNRRRRDVTAERRKTLTTKDTKDHKGAQSFFPWCDFVCALDRKSTRLNSSHLVISYAVFCLKKKKQYKLTDSKASERKTKPCRKLSNWKE